MPSQSFAIVTLSHESDYERCNLLVRSIKTFLAKKVTHYIVVDKSDFALFNKLNGDNIEIVTIEEIFPYIKRLPFARRWWFNFKGYPVRNWILQQIAKISLANYISEDVLVFIDSDVFFIKPFSFSELVHNDKVRLFRVAGEDQIESHAKWYRTAGKLLGLPPRDYYDARYIGNIITWRRDNVFKLYDHIEKISGRSWAKTLFSQWHFSEYILYGVFVDYILKEKAGHFYDNKNICLEYWEEQSMDESMLKKFILTAKPEHVAVMISSKAKIPISKYEHYVKNIH